MQRSLTITAVLLSILSLLACACDRGASTEATDVDHAAVREVEPITGPQWPEGGINPGELHNEILDAFMDIHPLGEPLDREELSREFVKVANVVLKKRGLTYRFTDEEAKLVFELNDEVKSAAGYDPYREGKDDVCIVIDHLEGRGEIQVDRARLYRALWTDVKRAGLSTYQRPLLATGSADDRVVTIIRHSHEYWSDRIGELEKCDFADDSWWERNKEKFKTVFVIACDFVGVIVLEGCTAGAGTGALAAAAALSSAAGAWLVY